MEKLPDNVVEKKNDIAELSEMLDNAIELDNKTKIKNAWNGIKEIMKQMAIVNSKPLG